MRFDDRLTTALGQPADSAAARQAVWRQLVDLLGQAGDEESDLRDLAFDRLRDWRAQVPLAGRQNAALLLAGQPIAADLVEFFAEDTTAVFAPLLAVVSLRGKVWRKLIPRLSPVARALLRHRRDLPDGAMRALEVFGQVDLVISGPVAPQLSAPEQYAAPDIQELRARIDAFREGKLRVERPPETEFAFEAGSDGVIYWCDSAVRTAVVGLSIAEAAPGQALGVDGQAAGAFRRRAPFSDARLTVAQIGEGGGAWSISGVPGFDPATGRFTGYRGTARRPRVGERAEHSGLLGAALSGDSLRQLAHEVRTPLNAISGFAEMIERQMLGPAPSAYRERAAAILRDTRQLESVLDDLHEATQLDEATLKLAAHEIDCAVLLAQVVSALKPMAAARDVAIALSIAPDCATVRLDPASAERMTTRLLSAAVGLAAPGERIAVDLSPGDGPKAETVIGIGRPRLVADFSERALLDACDIEGEQDGTPPVLGLGFTLRLVRGLAESSGGRLVLGADAFRLRLPAADAHDLAPDDEATAVASSKGTREWTDWLNRNAAASACQSEAGSAIGAGTGGACSSTVELAAHNGLVGGSNPSGPTIPH